MTARRRGWRPRADAELLRIIAMATAEDRRQRYPTVDALQDDLVRWRGGRPLRAAADSRGYRLRKFLYRHRWASVLALLAVLAVLAVLAFTWRLADERDRARVAERLANENATRSDAQQRFLAGFLLGAGSKGADGQPISGMAMLEQASQRLEAELSGNPAAYATIAEQLSQAYMNALDFRRAAELARTSIEHSRSGERAELLAVRWRLLARNLASLGETVEAEAACRKGLALLPEPPQSLEQARAATQLKVTLARIVDEPQALKQAREDVIAYAREHLPSGDPMRGPAAMMWAAQLELEERYAELVSARREALQEWQLDPSAFPTDLAMQELNLARALRLDGDLNAAETSVRAAQARLAQALGERAAPWRAGVDSELTEIFLQQGRIADARRLFDAHQRSSSITGQTPRFEPVWLEARLLFAEGKLAAARERAAQARPLIRFDAQRRWLDGFDAQLSDAR